MTAFTLGKGFVSDHLKYEKILDRLTASNTKNILKSYVKEGDVVVNCIGRTGVPNVDWCEDDDNKFDTAFTNVVLPLLISESCRELGAHLIQISSGCIYYNMNDVHEQEFANPESYYSKTKYASDLLIGDLPHVSNLRIRMPISSRNHHRNLINKLIGYNKVINELNSMTFMNDLVKCVDFFVKYKHPGTYHVVNPEPITAAEIVQEYQKYNPDHKFEIISLKKLDSLVKAVRSNCTLHTHKLNNIGFKMTPTKQALEHCMKNYCK